MSRRRRVGAKPWISKQPLEVQVELFKAYFRGDNAQTAFEAALKKAKAITGVEPEGDVRTVQRLYKKLKTEDGREEFRDLLDEAKRALEEKPRLKDFLDYEAVKRRLPFFMKLKDFKRAKEGLDYEKLSWEEQKNLWRKVVRIQRLERLWHKMIDKGYSYDPRDWLPGQIIECLQTFTEATQFKVLVDVRNLIPALKGELPTEEYKKIHIRGDNWLSREDYEAIMADPTFSLFEKLSVSIQLNLGCREGTSREPPNPHGREYSGIRGLRWEDVDWERLTLKDYEGKTGGGLLWTDCPLDILDRRTVEWLRAWHKECGEPKAGYILTFSKEGKAPMPYGLLTSTYRKINRFLGKPIVKGERMFYTAHDLRRTHATWLASLGVPLNMIAGKVVGDRAIGYMGVGWEDLSTLNKFYAMIMKERLFDVRRAIRDAMEGKTKELELKLPVNLEAVGLPQGGR